MSMTSYLPLAHSQDVKKCDINKKNKTKKRKSFLLLRLINILGQSFLIQFISLILSGLKKYDFRRF